MGKFGIFVKTATGVIATTAALLSALRDNPQVSRGIDEAVAKLKQAADSQNPKLRFDAKLQAIDTAADAVTASFPRADDAEGWHRQAQALRVRGELAWNSQSGGRRRKAMKALNSETAEILAQVNARLQQLQAEHPTTLPEQ